MGPIFGKVKGIAFTFCYQLMNISLFPILPRNISLLPISLGRFLFSVAQ